MKSIITRVLLVLLVFIVTVILGVLIIMNSSNVLTAFSITNVSHNYTNFDISFDKVKASSKYKIEVVDSNDDLIYSMFTTSTNNKFNIPNLVYEEEYSIMVYAYDDVGDYKPARDAYVFIYDDPVIDKSNIILNNIDYNLNIKGDLSSNNYNIVILKDNNTLVDESINSNTYLISSDYYKDTESILDVNLMSNGTIVDSIKLYNNINPIKDIIITSPLNNSSLLYDDVILTFDGGDNASSYTINLYQGNNLINSSDVLKKKVKLVSDLFNGGEDYRIDVIGHCGDYTKSSSVSFNMSSKTKMKPVYISNNWKYVRPGSKISLASPDENATIYYTLNGDDPLVDGILYTGPITIDQNVILKCVATGDLRDNSIVKEYDINVGTKNKLYIYISPSNQWANEGVHSTGFTTEKNEMNDLSNYVIEELRNHGVIVYRNNPSGNINQWNNDANYLGVDMKLAIHSNASTNHTAYGVETWIDNETSDTYSLANAIQNSLISLYPYKDREGYNRGVRYAQGDIGEANDSYVRFGMLVEVAHHDDLLDATWIMQNKKAIGYAMADAILRYYQVID